MAKYITLFEKHQLKNGVEENTETVFDSFFEGLSIYLEHLVSYKELVRLLNNGINKIEYNDESDKFDEFKDSVYILGHIENNTGDFKADTDMFYMISLQQLTEEEYKQYKEDSQIIYQFTKVESGSIEELTFSTYLEAKKHLMAYYDRFKHICEIVDNLSCECSEWHKEFIDDDNEFIWLQKLVRIEDDSDVYKKGQEIIFDVRVEKLTVKDLKYRNLQKTFSEAPDDSCELPFH